ncbi:MAG: hypothetical protein COZ06_26330 [Armatimonadetes bacterium CG_4_10_14_3_um_filter_66_18]|nr:hypothetical protein [Armatimonadota bacterium]PIX36721.1 MAG: hypothetical protein COZ57_38030 [Armatimonadetes bacterium CG_4_8_14_3_um_filter_66_20]PIY41705.1 MAG: hypothetical protein COZ06_26330 [Armatimonadetes bacterium CG_4_10_14_3_um_filter_66_18]PJB74302.1 MAG: hypothetical protein CO096_03950 [Armatimonadetes bacterium CG_4_9_14_3_um_filter_66_14]
MLGWLRELDELLRGSKTHPQLLAKGTAHLRLRPLVLVSIALAVVYGVCMGCFSVFNRTDPQYLQLLASGLKVPALFFLTLLVTFPSLYVFSALLGVRLGPVDTLRVVVAALAVNLAVLASFALITLFFTFCTTSYPFMKLLNFVFFAAAGAIGLGFLMTMLQRLEAAHFAPAPNDPESGQGEAELPSMDGLARSTGEAEEPDAPRPSLLPWPLPAERTAARRVFRLWVVLYALVGAQMGWVLRPFIGAPDLAFTWFRAREANILLDLIRALGELLGY